MISSFNLVSEPWIRVLRGTGGTEEVSIRQFFHDAHRYAALAGEIPMQDAAVLRLLLAILYRATAAPRTGDEAVLLWGQWWAGSLPTEALDGYLDQHMDRFDLFDNENPFFQVAGLRTASGATSGLEKLIAEVPAGSKFFTTRDGVGIDSLSPAEAARWLVALHSSDISGIKTGAVGDDRVKGGRGYPIGVGVTGRLGLVLVEGESLRETLLLNVVLTLADDDDSAPWERPAYDAGVSWLHPEPMGPADLYTWQARRALLIASGGRVVDALICNGDKLGPQNLHIHEPLSSWRFSDSQSKKLKQPTWMPQTHDPNRSIWRGLEVLLSRAVPESKKIRPRVFDWLAELRRSKVLSSDEFVKIRTVGFAYGPKESSLAAAIDDVLPVSIALFGDDNLANAAVQGAKVAQNAVVDVANLASNLARAASLESGARRDLAFVAAYDALDPLFRRWVRDLRSTSSISERENAWRVAVGQTLLALGSDLCAESGRAAIVGRIDPDTGQVMDMARAWSIFTWQLHRDTDVAASPGETALPENDDGKGTR